MRQFSIAPVTLVLAAVGILGSCSLEGRRGNPAACYEDEECGPLRRCDVFRQLCAAVGTDGEALDAPRLDAGPCRRGPGWFIALPCGVSEERRPRGAPWTT
jgi:hypothetical protein